MSKLIDKAVDWFLRLMDNPSPGHKPLGPKVDSKRRYTWLFAKCSGDSSGTIPGKRLTVSWKVALGLKNVNVVDVPICHMESEFVWGLMDRLTGLDVVDLVPEKTVGFERKMCARANSYNNAVLVFVRAADTFYIQSPDTLLLDQMYIGGTFYDDEDVFPKLRVPYMVVNIPLKGSDWVVKKFFENFSRYCNNLADCIVEVDNEGLET